MNKNLARENWRRCLKLVTRGFASEVLTHPINDVVLNAKIGEYDKTPDDKYKAFLSEYDQITFGMWGHSHHRTAGEILIRALSKTDIPDDRLDEIIEILAEASAHTQYEDEQEPSLPDSSALKTAIEHSKLPTISEAGSLPAYSPKEIESWLHTEGGIVGQDAAVRTASLIMYNHIEGRPSVSLFAGPTGSGKTAIWRALQRKYGTVCIVIHDASTLTAEGWKGGNKISAIFKNVAPELRGKIVLVLDEFDKLLEPQYGANGTNYSDIMQSQLLRLLDHDTLFFGDESGKGDSFSVDASGVSVVLLGAFQRLLEKQGEKSSIGFGGRSRKSCNYSNTEITVENLVEYGMREEIAGRITRITCLDPLDVTTLMRIGRNEAERLERLMMREVSVENNTLMRLADTAMAKGLGARWLNSQIGIMLDNLIYEAPYAKRYCIEYEPSDSDEFIPT